MNVNVIYEKQSRIQISTSTIQFVSLFLFLCIFCPFHFRNVKKECKSLTTTNFIIRITEYNKFYASSIGISIQIEAIWSV